MNEGREEREGRELREGEKSRGSRGSRERREERERERREERERERGRRESRKGISEHKNTPPGVFWVFPDIVGGREGVDHPKRAKTALMRTLRP